MIIAFYMRVVIAMLILTLAAQGQNQAGKKQGAGSGERANQASNQNNSTQTPISTPAPAQPSPQNMPNEGTRQRMPDQGSTPDTPAGSPSPAPKEALSQLSLFLFGSGVAFFIALLAWSDQIRGINQDIRELETRFLDGTSIDKRMFLRIVKPESPDDRGLALLEVASTGRIKKKDQAQVIQIFTDWNKQWSRIESLSSWKYYLTITLTATLFVAGTASLFTSPDLQVRLFSMPVRVEMLILLPPALLVVSILVIVVCIAKRENVLRSLLKSVSDMV